MGLLYHDNQRRCCTKLSKQQMKCVLTYLLIMFIVFFVFGGTTIGVMNNVNHLPDINDTTYNATLSGYAFLLILSFVMLVVGCMGGISLICDCLSWRLDDDGVNSVDPSIHEESSIYTDPPQDTESGIKVEENMTTNTLTEEEVGSNRLKQDIHSALRLLCGDLGSNQLDPLQLQQEANRIYQDFRKSNL